MTNNSVKLKREQAFLRGPSVSKWALSFELSEVLLPFDIVHPLILLHYTNV